jgi:GNAT superfamily N-acetyltransferase
LPRFARNDDGKAVKDVAYCAMLRQAEPEDAMAVARVHVRAWQVGYRGLLPEEYLNHLRPEEWALRYDFASLDPLKPRTIVEVEGGAVRGFATTMPSRDADLPEHGELCALYVDPVCWGRGFGVELMAAARAQLLESGFRCGVLWVLAGNERAARFYRRNGWVPDGRCKTDFMHGVEVNEVRYQRS